MLTSFVLCGPSKRRMEHDRSLEQSVDYKVYSQRREFEVNINQTRAMLTEIVTTCSEFRVLAKLMLSLLAVLQSVNINYEAAVVMLYSMQQLTSVFATPKNGIIDRAKKKKIDLPSRDDTSSIAYTIVTELENLFDESARYFEKFTGDDSANHMLTSDLIKKKVYNFMETVYKASYKLCQIYLVKKNTHLGVELVLPSEYEIISNIRPQIEEAAVNNEEVVRLARLALLKKQVVIKNRPDNTASDAMDAKERRNEEMRRLKETIEEVTQEVSATIDLIHNGTAAAESLVRTGVHMAIPQVLVRSLWRDYVGTNVLCIPVDELIKKFNKFLKDKKEIVETFEGLLNGLKFILLCCTFAGKSKPHFVSHDTFIDSDDYCHVDATLMARMVRYVKYDETDPRAVLESVLRNNISNYRDLFPLFNVVNQKNNSLSYSEYTLKKRFAPFPRSSDTNLKPIDDVEIMHHALIPGFYNMIGAPLSGKTHTILNLCHSHKRLVHKSIVYIDFAYARNRRVAESKVVSQLFLYDLYTSSDILDAFNSLLLSISKEHSLVIFDNVSFSNKTTSKGTDGSCKDVVDESDSFHIFLKELIGVCNRFINIFSFMLISDRAPSSSSGYTKDVVVIKNRITMPLASHTASHSFAVQRYYQDVPALTIAAMGHCGLLSTLPKLSPLHIVRKIASYLTAAKEAQVVETERADEIRNNLASSELRDDVISLIAKGIVEAMGRDERLLAYCMLIDSVSSFDEGSLWSISKDAFESDLFSWHIALKGLLLSQWLVYSEDMSYSLNPVLTMHRSGEKIHQLLKDIIRMIQLYEYPENSFDNIIISSGSKSDNGNTYKSEAIIFPTNKQCLLAYYNHYAGDLLRINNLSSTYISYFDTIAKDLPHFYNLFETFLSNSIESDTENIVMTGIAINTEYYSSIINRINENKTLLYTSFDKKKKHDIDSNLMSYQMYENDQEYNFNERGSSTTPAAKEKKTPGSDKKKSKNSSISEEDLMTLAIKFAGNLHKVLSRMSMGDEENVAICLYVVHFLERRGERGLLYFRAVVDLCDFLRRVRVGSKQLLPVGVSIVEQLLAVYLVGNVPERDRGRATIAKGALLDALGRQGDALICYENGIIIWGIQDQVATSDGWKEGGFRSSNVDYMNAMRDIERIKEARGARKSRISSADSRDVSSSLFGEEKSSNWRPKASMLGNRSFSEIAMRATKRQPKNAFKNAVKKAAAAAAKAPSNRDSNLSAVAGTGDAEFGEAEDAASKGSGKARPAGCRCSVM